MTIHERIVRYFRGVRERWDNTAPATQAAVESAFSAVGMRLNTMHRRLDDIRGGQASLERCIDSLALRVQKLERRRAAARKKGGRK